MVSAEQQVLHRLAEVGRAFDRQVGLRAALRDDARFGQLHRAHHRDAALLVEVDADRQVDLVRPRVGVENLDQRKDRVAREGLDMLQTCGAPQALAARAASMSFFSDAGVSVGA